MMKKHFLLFMAICLSLNLCACGIGEKPDSNGVVFSVKDYPMQVICPEGWWQTDADNFDLQCESKNNALIMSIFCYHEIDLPENMSRQEFFESQNQMLLDMRDQASLIEDMSEKQYADKKIASVLYSAENEGHKNYYYMNLVSIDNSDYFAWVLFTGMPSEINAQRDTIDEILQTIKLTEG